ncbi:hypothetical protein [Flavobacterium dankookense]|uniref:Uncharacterized protein n=1 Tax=Flavobacterium dankookense TaxID=706186 RepID=A0A4R6QCF7_9FLAO|nr:hypothetical protein [Flavobacterium dankookense]TDP60101.1 hypothetical protein BC748_1074 [Flavobacterium dankookense]
MKKAPLIKAAILIIYLLGLSSCSSDDAAIVEDNGITTGNYFPLITNNKWWYTNNGEVSLVYVGYTNNFEGIPYYRINDDGSDFNIPQWMLKKGASYYQKSGEVLMPLEGGATLEIGEYEIKMFRDDLSVGATWSGSTPLHVIVYNNGAHQKLPASLTYTGTILERDASETLNDVTYTNIIKMQLHAVETVNSQVTNIEAEYWFAKDIGLIRESVTSSTDNVTKTRTLTSHELN